jgi:hypothetical protein
MRGLVQRPRRLNILLKLAYIKGIVLGKQHLEIATISLIYNILSNKNLTSVVMKTWDYL